MILVSRISAASTSAGSVVNLGKDKSIPHGGAPALSVGNCHPAPFPSIGTRKGTDINVRIGCLEGYLQLYPGCPWEGVSGHF